MKRTLIVFAVLIALPVAALAQKPVTRTESVVVTATIEAIDHDARTVVLKDKDGNLESFYAGPEIKRFDDLKVGDKVTFRYTESVVVKLSKPGEPVKAAASGEPKVERKAGPKPSGSVTQEETATVLIKAINPDAPSVTVRVEDGRTMSFKVENKSLLQNFKAGDKVEITYTAALVVSVE